MKDNLLVDLANCSDGKRPTLRYRKQRQNKTKGSFTLPVKTVTSLFTRLFFVVPKGCVVNASGAQCRHPAVTQRNSGRKYTTHRSLYTPLLTLGLYCSYVIALYNFISHIKSFICWLLSLNNQMSFVHDESAKKIKLHDEHRYKYMHDEDHRLLKK